MLMSEEYAMPGPWKSPSMGSTTVILAGPLFLGMPSMGISPLQQRTDADLFRVSGGTLSSTNSLRTGITLCTPEHP